MNLESALQLLNESNGTHSYEIYIPSVGKNLMFKPITTGQQKTISKFSIGTKTDVKFNFNYEMLKLGLFDTLVIGDEISSDQLTEIDIIAFFAGVRVNNISDPLEIKFTCGKCGTTFDKAIDMEKIIERCKNYKAAEFDFSFTVDDNKYNLGIAEPTYKNLLELEEYLIQMKETMDYNVDEIVELRAFTKPSVYIKTVNINGMEIDSFSSAGFVEKLTLYNSLPPKITFNGKDSILNLILRDFDLEATQNMMGDVECTNEICKEKLEGVLTNDSFFII
jgi:hypothetical protein